MQSPFDSPMGSGGIDIEAVRERLRGLQESAAQRAAATQELSEQLRAVTATATDEAHVVTVTVDSSGNVTDLRLSERIRGRQPDWLSETIMATIGAARANLAEQTREVVERTVGADSATGQAIVHRFDGGAGSGA
ncbi:YbaB/EbfC family nucleoid-associated protein [Glycomyces sp. NPDC046736]|uniref:YbaB/EbfC family nucleoid-associated protein n=1 Tax=Glycomyces sp. NPDC046736 TaxID=3155615 RepID=UPI0033D28CD1